MDPKLRPSFADTVRHLEEILARLKVEEMEQECSGDNDKKTIPKGTVRTLHKISQNLSFTVNTRHLFLFTRRCL